MKYFALVLCLMSLLPGTSVAQMGDTDMVQRKKVEVYQADMKRVEVYLNALKSFAASFKQTADDGEKSGGMFYLLRPGKLRWEYDPPTPIIIIAKGSLLTYYDTELEQVSHVGLDDTLAGFLTRETISFTEGIRILKFNKADGQINITIAQKDKESEGELTMVFSDKPVELQSIAILDAVGKKTLIEFEGSVRDVPLGEELFVLPKPKNKRKRQ